MRGYNVRIACVSEKADQIVEVNLSGHTPLITHIMDYDLMFLEET